MKKNIIIVVLAIIAIIEFMSIKDMSAQASYHMQCVEVCKHVITNFESCYPDYVDTVTGDDYWSIYSEDIR